MEGRIKYRYIELPWLIAGSLTAVYNTERAQKYSLPTGGRLQYAGDVSGLESLFRGACNTVCA